MYHQFQQGNSEDAWNYTTEELWRSVSASRHSFLDVASNERTPLLSQIITPSSHQVTRWTESFWKRAFVLNILPVLIVLVWCSIPIPFDDCESLPCDYENYTPTSINNVRWISLSNIITSSNNTSIQPHHQPALINFWFFLFWYYGVYNAVALFLITKMFSIYALNWWPKLLGAKLTFLLYWSTTQGIAIVACYFTTLGKYTLSWVILTFFTMSLPVISAFANIHSNRMNRRQSAIYFASDSAKKFSPFTRSHEHTLWHVPASYRRFLWFCVVLLIALFALIGGEAYAYFFLSSLPHTSLDAVLYVYSWVGAIYVMDTITDYIINRRICSHPLATVFKLYFFMIYFIFYRNLFARLRSVDQFAIVQLGSFLWVCLYYPLVIAPHTHQLWVRLFGITLTYEEYRDKIGRSFYLRNLAENTTMLGFLCWVNILHFGPNRAAYPYFYFNDRVSEESPYTHQMTFIAAVIIWSSELTSAYITRWTFKRYFHHSVTEQAIKEFTHCPEMIIAFVFIMIHVLQNILLALIKLDFA
ncbi:hypothetical protein BDF14DRAFT_1879334 [Spinellus fusiger]|nr:hypothetical protein BDF14DRAFT_1879334 [Spinellus fusiger]